jgi:hypothetical protein
VSSKLWSDHQIVLLLTVDGEHFRLFIFAPDDEKSGPSVAVHRKGRDAIGDPCWNAVSNQRALSLSLVALARFAFVACVGAPHHRCEIKRSETGLTYYELDLGNFSTKDDMHGHLHGE